MNDQHEPTDACASVHCHSHHVDENPGRYYIGCYECGHVYRTARELRRAYRRQSFTIPRYDIPWWRITWRALTIRARDIHFCQECIHDF